MSDRTEATSPTKAWLHLPDRALAGCIYMGAERDTRGPGLDAAQRFNYYPASPLPMLSAGPCWCDGGLPERSSFDDVDRRSS